MTKEFDPTEDIIDVRDMTDRLEELESLIDAIVEKDPQGESEEMGELRPEKEKLENILSELSGTGGDHKWRGDWYPVTLIRDSYFEDHARELAEDIGAIDRNASWPNNFIDWKAAAEALQGDYTAIEIDKETYWYR